eukprot:Em0007g509a
MERVVANVGAGRSREDLWLCHFRSTRGLSGKQLIGPGPRPFDSSIDVRREGLETVLFSYVTVRVTPEVSINIYGGTIEQMAALMSSLEEPL